MSIKTTVLTISTKICDVLKPNWLVFLLLQIRLFVLEVLESFLDKKGENYLTVLPDSVPLLAEALEDDNSKVEAKCRKLIRKMEEIFGHSIESYFE